jgi:hypothetical protein
MYITRLMNGKDFAFNKEAKFPSHPWGVYHKFSISQLKNKNCVALVYS